MIDPNALLVLLEQATLEWYERCRTRRGLPDWTICVIPAQLPDYAWMLCHGERGRLDVTVDADLLGRLLRGEVPWKGAEVRTHVTYHRESAECDQPPQSALAWFHV